MTKEEQLKAIIEKAEKGGWRPRKYLLPSDSPDWKEAYLEDDYYSVFIFSHDFLKAFAKDLSVTWEKLGKELVASEDRIEYLFKHL